MKVTGTLWGDSLAVVEAHVTFWGRGDGHGPSMLFSGYRSSHVHFDALEPFDYLASFQLVDREELRPGESGAVVMELIGPSDVDVKLPPGSEFRLYEAGERIATGAITRVISLRRLG